MKQKINEFGMSLGVAIAMFLLVPPTLAAAPELEALCIDRAAIERIYHAHRLGTKRPFEEAMPPSLIAKTTRLNLHKEAVLRDSYQVEISPAKVAAEVRRINATTRAPEVLAEIKHALGDDPVRFARSMVKPILVERELRHRFNLDDALHLAKRQEAELARQQLLAGQSVEDMREVTWLLTPRPEEDPPQAGSAGLIGTPVQTEGVAKSADYSVEATAQIAQALTPPDSQADDDLYFEDLDPELQKVLRVQLQKPGDVSAVIEMPSGFLVFLASIKNDEQLDARSLSIPKRSYDEWLKQAPKKKL